LCETRARQQDREQRKMRLHMFQHCITPATRSSAEPAQPLSRLPEDVYLGAPNRVRING
jgi:hypothetical protein